MSGALKAVGTAAGVVSMVAMFIPGGQPVAMIAAAVSAAANVGAQMTAKPPPARGNVNDITIGANQPTPYLIGETYYGGSRQHWVGYGEPRRGVINPNLFMADVYSACGPVEALVGTYLDHVLVPFDGSNEAIGYFRNHLWRYPQLGLDPEPAALGARWPGVPDWGADHRLSSYAAIGWSMSFDRDGKIFASGIAQTGAVWRGVRVYDPRKDDGYPGGIGMHRIDDETTWEWSENPGLHGLVYALGRYRQGRKVFGIGEPVDGIRIADFVALANVCDANGWKVGGVIFEGAQSTDGEKWNNLKDICFAGGAKPGWVGGLLALDISAPRVALDRITEDDLADDDIEVGAMQGWEDRLNTLTPKYRSRDHKYEYVQSSPVQIASYLEEDGEEKGEERQFNLVQDKDQAAQLCAYELMDRRELGEIVVRLKPRLRKYGMGDLLIVHLPEDGLVEQPCVILHKGFDPVSMSVLFVMRGETPAKHPFALGQTGTAPPTPALGGTEAIDDLASVVREASGAVTIPTRSAITLSSTTTTIAIGAFTGSLSTGGTRAFPAGEVVGLAMGTAYQVFQRRSDGSYFADAHPALDAMADAANILIGSISTQAEGGGYAPPPDVPPGWGGGGGGYEPIVAIA